MAERGSEFPNRPRRLRTSVGMTLHPDTIARFDFLTDKFRLGRGQLVDKLILSLHTSVSQGRLTCIHGELCRMARTDVPQVM
jgi:hypothetical protein